MLVDLVALLWQWRRWLDGGRSLGRAVVFFGLLASLGLAVASGLLMLLKPSSFDILCRAAYNLLDLALTACLALTLLSAIQKGWKQRG